MANEKTDVSKLPTLDDFKESSLLQKSELEKQAAASATATATTTSTETKVDTTKDTETKKVVEDKKKAVVKDKKDDAAAVISDEALTALKAKADKDIDSLTEEERKILIDKDYLEEKPSSTFWEDVSKIHGIELDVDFGDVDPESVEGAALRDNALVDKTVTDYLNYLKTNFPSSYKFLEHEANGGKLEELLPTIKNDYSKIELKEEDKELQTQILKDFYKGKGFDEKRIQRLIEADTDSEEGLFKIAQAALTEQINKQKKEENLIIERTKQQAEMAKARDDQFRNVLKTITDKGAIGEFVINNKNEKEEFYNFLLGSTYYNDKTQQYQVVLPLDQESLIPVLQQMLFSFKDGNLQDYVKREAGTKLVRKLQKKVAQDTNKVASQDNNTQTDVKKLPTLDAFTIGG